MSDKVQLIKEEIEKRLSSLWDLIPEGKKVLKDDFTKEDANNLGRYTELENLLKFIDSLPEEPASEDLEKEIKRYLHEVYDRDTMVGDVARHFAEWQKEQMMKDAVEGVIDIRKWPAKAQVEFYDRLPIFNVRTGDKVKIIIIKED